jgi:pimeloyl-ACP methyl ester carboxylesterase
MVYSAPDAFFQAHEDAIVSGVGGNGAPTKRTRERCGMSRMSPTPAAVLPAAPMAHAETAVAVQTPQVRYKTVAIDGVDVFYREAGPPDAPVLVLLHGFPTSSHMFRNLIPALADRYRVIAPDYPGFGNSGMPRRDGFAYTFENYASVVGKFTERLGFERYALYVMDYGAPVGFRLATAHPERVTAIVVQNGNAYDEGLQQFWGPIRAYWKSGSTKDREALRWLTSLKATKWQYADGVSDATVLSPDAWIVDQAFLDRPGIQEIQLDLFYDYRTNLPLYPAWQQYFHEHQPPMLVVWGKNDQIFVAAGAEAYRRDNPRAEIHLLDTGHFALETHGPEIARLICDFLGRVIPVKTAQR